MSQDITELAKALSNAQLMFKKAALDKVNPHFKSKYASLESILSCCKEGLNKNGLSITQGTVVIDGKPYFLTTLMHVSGQWRNSIMPIHLNTTSPQAFGSLLSYYRRYGIGAMLALSTGDEDDDANTATAEIKKKPLNISEQEAKNLDAMISGPNSVEFRKNMLAYYSQKDELKQNAISFTEIGIKHLGEIKKHIARRREDVQAD